MSYNSTFDFQSESKIIFLFVLVIVVVLVSFVGGVFFVVSYKKLLDREGFSSYECGFNILSKARIFFSLRFFLISILFLVFDVEIALILPLPFIFYNSGAITIFYIFFIVLIVGLLYEYFYGSLNWLNFISKA